MKEKTQNRHQRIPNQKEMKADGQEAALQPQLFHEEEAFLKAVFFSSFYPSLRPLVAGRQAQEPPLKRQIRETEIERECVSLSLSLRCAEKWKSEGGFVIAGYRKDQGIRIRKAKHNEREREREIDSLTLSLSHSHSQTESFRTGK